MLSLPSFPFRVEIETLSPAVDSTFQVLFTAGCRRYVFASSVKQAAAFRRFEQRWESGDESSR